MRAVEPVPAALRVVIVEDQVLLREGLARLFADGGHEVVATLGDATALGALLGADRPDLVVLDVRMPPTYTFEGTEAAREIKERFPGTGVLVLSQHIETAHMAGLVAQAGFGYLLKDRVLEVREFLAAAERVARGGSALDPKVIARLVTPVTDGPVGRLSERERRVLELMAEGLTNTGIAQRLVISERTVEAHVRRVLMKLSLPEGEDGHRRVLAVLAHLRSVHGWV
ncbi:response regulator transcription factor [Streptomyces sp. NPDC051940]|uniref:response regulator transcription factor n=1 Tax=Streptomyces sp. NPDC051940 TaxID=3155675 RepID=UPI00341BD1C3